MRRVWIVLTAVALMGVGACQQNDQQVWFKGGLETAFAEAAARETVVMVEFYTDWCNWCRRMDSDTFADPQVRNELSRLVALKLDAEKGGSVAASRYGVDSYPTLIFLDARGNEMERILGYLPPEKFLRRVQRIRSGDTFLACLRTLEEDPGNLDAIERSVQGLLERSDPEGAISRIEAFHRATEGEELDVCRRLMFAARVELHARVYQRAARLYQRGWGRGFDVPNTDGTASLYRIMEEGLVERPVDEQAELLREARHQDAAVLLEIPDVERIVPVELLDVADFAFTNGHYDLAADLYLSWYDREGATASSGNLNDVAWRLYLSGRETVRAIQIARQSFAANPDSETADTLARLLYVNGEVSEAVALEERAAETAEPSRGEAFRIIAQRMLVGERLDDRPTFDGYPGKRRRML